MLTSKEKSSLNDIARAIREVYNFSLVPEDKNFKRPEKIAEEMGGGILVDKSVFWTKVCRCGNGFVITMPDTLDLTEEISRFADGIAMLVFCMKFNVSGEDFMKNKNMQSYAPNFRESELVNYLAGELACPHDRIMMDVRKCQDEYGAFRIKDVSDRMGLKHSFLESRMVSCGMINRW